MHIMNYIHTTKQTQNIHYKYMYKTNVKVLSILTVHYISACLQYIIHVVLTNTSMSNGVKVCNGIITVIYCYQYKTLTECLNE